MLEENERGILMKTPLMHSPIQINQVKLSSRLVMPPMATEKSAGDGQVTEALVAYYDEKTKGGHVGLLITEHSYIDVRGKASPHQVSLADDNAIAGYKKIVDAVHANGSKIMAQINHAGSAAKIVDTGMVPLSASAVMNANTLFHKRGTLNQPEAMTQKDIDAVIQQFVKAAVRVKKAGADGVEIHAAHGYLLGQFYSPLTNKRTDAYTGATLEGRTLLQRQVVAAVRQAVGDDFLVAMRFGAADYMEGGALPSEVEEAACLLAPGLDLLDISGNMCGYMRTGHTEPGWFAELSRAAKKGSELPVILTGGIKTAAEGEALLADKAADLIGIGRIMLQPGTVAARLMAE